MNKVELISAISEETNLSKKDVEAVLKSFVNVTSSELAKKGNIQLIGFGTFKTSERAAREGINPLTQKPMTIEATTAVKFVPGKALKEAVNKK